MASSAATATTVMKKVFKYDLPVEGGPQTVFMPRGSQILHIGHQGDPAMVCIWALVHTGEPAAIAKTFYVVGTGQELPEPSRWTFVGTVNYHPVPLVWHVFQEAIK